MHDVHSCSGHASSQQSTATMSSPKKLGMAAVNLAISKPANPQKRSPWKISMLPKSAVSGIMLGDFMVVFLRYD